MGVNKIHLIFGQTTWRPTHYLKQDYSAFSGDDWKEEVMGHVHRGAQCLLWDAFHSGAKDEGNHEFIYDGIGDRPNVTYIPRCEHHYVRKGAWHPICTGLNSILTMAIWAVELGFKEIVLVGCDGHFNTPKDDHFVDDYYKAWDFDYANRNNINVNLAHHIITNFCPVPVYDATVGGKLTCYPKVRLEDYV